MKYFILTLSILCAVSCTSKKGNPSPTVSAPEIDGLLLTDYDANPQGMDGHPNVRTMDSLYTVGCYPNPCAILSDCFIYYHGTSSGTAQATLVAGRYTDTLPTGAVVANQALYGQVKPILSVTSSIVSGNNTLSLNTDSIPTGFYRMNIYISGANGNDTFWNNVWVKH